MTQPDLITTSKLESPVIAATAATVLVALVALLRLKFAHSFIPPIGYGVPVVLVASFRRRLVLWAMVAVFAAMTVAKFSFTLPAIEGPHLLTPQYDHWAAIMVLMDLLVVSCIADLWIISNRTSDRRNRELQTANSELAGREEQIVRQNEELQNQTEELERQREELAVSNEELSRREHTLEVLLTLSRSLATDLSRQDMLERICQTLTVLISGPGISAAILEKDGDQFAVQCHRGFGDGGVKSARVALNRSFASIVLESGRTACLEDISRRPDLEILQPSQGPANVSVMAAPLRVGGRIIGALEVCSWHATHWNDNQIMLLESLAAQTSVSLDAARMFETIMREQHRFEAVWRTVPVGIAVAADNGSDVRVNPAGAAILGVAADQNLLTVGTPGLPWQVLHRNGPLDGENSPLMRALAGQEVREEECEVSISDEKHVVLLIYARPIHDAASHWRGAVAAFTDLTRQKELQRELDMRRRDAEEASIRKTRFLAAVSHDIRTPANAISLLAELIRRTAAIPSMSAEVPQLAHELQQSASSLVNLLGDVLDIARFDSGKVELQYSDFPLRDLLEDESQRMLPLAREKGLKLSWSAPDEPIILHADHLKLQRILDNLIGNAVKFTGSGSIRIEAGPSDEGGIRLRVIDSGIGIDPKNLRHIFDEFFQLGNPERDRNKGSGLGLTICQHLVDAMGGRVEVQSEVGVGSTFTVTLPASIVVATPATQPVPAK